MPIFRVEKTQNYTVMSNYHLRDKTLSLKAKGLLSYMLSLPENWDYSIKGLASVLLENADAVRTTVKELEQAGYIIRTQKRDEKGKMLPIEYTVYEHPNTKNFSEEPLSDNPITVCPKSENSIQRNTNKTNKNEINKQSFLSAGMEKNDVNDYELLIKENINYENLIQERWLQKDMIDEMIAIIVETLCSKRKSIRIAGDDYPAELVKKRFLMLQSEHICFALDGFKNNTTEVKNIKQYIKTILYNAPVTIDSYYTAKVAHDMSSAI